MKFSLKKMLVSGLIVGAMTFCAAGASSFDSAAQSLSDLGLVTGTADGFDLDRASTRGEVAAMLVRLMGKEAEATEAWKTDESSFAFTDMDNAAWAKPYVNWLVKNNLAAGTTETTFAPRDTCSAQMAATFLLRALGYSDAEGGDFTYFTSMDFAREKGLVDEVNCDEKNFQRDHLMAMCYTALSCQPKGSEGDLLSKLVADGAVADNDASKKVREHFSNCRAVAAASEKYQNSASMAFKMTADMDMKLGAESMKMKMDQDIAMKADMEKLDALEMAMTGSITIDEGSGEPTTVPNAMYVKDGTAYVESAGQKMKMPMDFEQAMSQVGMSNMQQVSSLPVTMVESVTATTADGKTTYEVVYNAKLMSNMVSSIMDSMMGSLGDVSGATVSIDKVAVKEVVANGELESMDMDMSMSVGVGADTVQTTAKIQMVITGMGDAVKITFPASFDDYVDSAADTTAPAADTTAPAADTTAPAADTTAPAADTTAPAADTTTPAETDSSTPNAA